jgi:hypothetical protein
MENFTPYSAAIGGLLIGVAAVLLMAMNGRIMGISGILGQLVIPAPGDIAWRVAFVVGLVAAPVAYGLIAMGGLPQVTVDVSALTVVLGGLLVGIGTRFGGGCTSGHGVCGMARFSVRSISATVTFVAVAMLTVYVTRHLMGI